MLELLLQVSVNGLIHPVIVFTWLALLSRGCFDPRERLARYLCMSPAFACFQFVFCFHQVLAWSLFQRCFLSWNTLSANGFMVFCHRFHMLVSWPSSYVHLWLARLLAVCGARDPPGCRHGSLPLSRELASCQGHFNGRIIAQVNTTVPSTTSHRPGGERVQTNGMMTLPPPPHQPSLDDSRELPTLQFRYFNIGIMQVPCRQRYARIYV